MRLENKKLIFYHMKICAVTGALEVEKDSGLTLQIHYQNILKNGFLIILVVLRQKYLNA